MTKSNRNLYMIPIYSEDVSHLWYLTVICLLLTVAILHLAIEIATSLSLLIYWNGSILQFCPMCDKALLLLVSVLQLPGSNNTWPNITFLIVKICYSNGSLIQSIGFGSVYCCLMFLMAMKSTRTITCFSGSIEVIFPSRVLLFFGWNFEK